MKLYDAIIIGGSIAGLSAALTLGRSRRDILVIDNGKPCNRFTAHSHNFLTQDGSTPAQIIETAKEQVSKYETVNFYNGEVADVEIVNEIFMVKLNENNENFHARKIILATGLRDILPEIEGLKKCWGITAIHCPYCHGYELKDRKTGVLANGEKAFHLAKLARNLTQDVTIFTQGRSELTDEQIQDLHSHQIAIVEDEIQEVQHENGNIHSLKLKHSTFSLEVLYVKSETLQSSSIPESLQCKFTDSGLIEVDFLQRTSVSGVFAAGDNASPFRSVSAAAASGNLAGATVNAELCI